MLPLVYSPLAAFISVETYLFLRYLSSDNANMPVTFFKKILCHIICRCRIINRYGRYVVIPKALAAGCNYDTWDLHLLHTVIKKCKIGSQKHNSLWIHTPDQFDGILYLIAVLIYILHYDIFIITRKLILYPLYYIREQHVLISFYDDNNRRFRCHLEVLGVDVRLKAVFLYNPEYLLSGCIADSGLIVYHPGHGSDTIT